MGTWEDKITDCMVNEGKRCHLKGVELRLLSATRYNPDYWYWLGWARANSN